MKKFFLFIIILGVNINLFSQKYSISGYISDAGTTEKLVSAIVKVKNQNIVCVSNDYGFYYLPFDKKDTITLLVSYLGYETKKQRIIINGNKIINFKLKANNNIDTVIISSERRINETTETGTNRIYSKQLFTLPSLGCENDIFKAIQLLPGIQRGAEGSNGIYVRGGNNDENLILIDDVSVYNINHLGGFISIFNPDAINSAKIIKSGFPAKYGGRLSSVIDIRLKDGNLNRFSGSFSISPITSNLSINGPLKKQKSSFILSLRAFYLGLFTVPYQFFKFEGYLFGYNFHDINMKISNKINKNNKIFLSFYEGNDNSFFKLNNFLVDNTTIGFSNRISSNLLSSFRWNHIYDSKIFSNTTIAFTKYKYENSEHFYSTNSKDDFFSSLKTGITDILIKNNYDYYMSQKIKLNFGTDLILHDFSPLNIHQKKKSNISDYDTIYQNKNIKGFSLSFYAQSKLIINKTITANIGFRVNDYIVEQKHFLFLAPRAMFIFQLKNNSSIKMSYSATQQNIHLIQNENSTVPMNIWLAADTLLPPEQAYQISLGFYKFFSQKNINFSIETYYKKLNNLVTNKEGTTYYSSIVNRESCFEKNGKGNAYGIEFLLQKDKGKTKFWISYTISKSTRQFENINFGKVYPFEFDRRHNINIVITQKLKKNIDFSANWIFGSGYPFTLPIAIYDSPKNLLYDNLIFQNLIYSNKNSYRMRAYHRLDIAFSFNKIKKHGIRTWKISIYNLYNRQNPFLYYSSKKTGKWEIYQISLFPFIPSFSYSFRFI